MSDLSLFQSSLRDAFRPRRLAITLVVALLPALLGLLWRLLSPAGKFDGESVYDSLVPSLIFSFSLTILSVIYSTNIVSQELEQRTIVYLLTRPIPRWRILVAKFAASLVIVWGTTMASTVLLALALFGFTRFGTAGVGPDLLALLLGGFAYGSLFLLLATLLTRPLIYGLMFVFGWETWVPTLPGAFAKLSIMTYLRALSAREITPDAAPADTSGNILLMFGSAPKVEVPVSQAWIVLIAVTVVALAGALVVFSTREYAPRDDAE